jgi:hypothetical protein
MASGMPHFRQNAMPKHAAFCRNSWPAPRGQYPVMDFFPWGESHCHSLRRSRKDRRSSRREHDIRLQRPMVLATSTGK